MWRATSDTYNFKEDLRDISTLATGIFLSQVAWTAMKVTDTALIFATKVGEPHGVKA